MSDHAFTTSAGRHPIDRYVVIGNPVAHSLSPRIHHLFAELTGQAMHYEHCLSPLDGFAATIAQLREQGVRGGNVTIPFKAEAAALAQCREERVELAGAANTLRFEADGRISAFNTDGLGLVRDITLNAGHAIAGSHLLLLGAGGAAAGALAELIRAAPASILVANRTLPRALQLCQRHEALARSHNCALQACALERLEDAAVQPFALVINATAASLQGQSLPLAPVARQLASGALIYDMMYGASASHFLQALAGSRTDLQCRDGLGMLVEQAAEAFAIWRGLRPPAARVLGELRTQLNTAGRADSHTRPAP